MKKKLTSAIFYNGSSKFLLLFFLVNSISGFASNNTISNSVIQEKTVTGVVKDESDLALPGASVSVKGTNKGTITDLDGIFTIDVNESDTLVFRYTGYTTQEVLVGASTNLTIILKENEALLDEIVVVGYRTQSKKDITGSVVVVKGDDIVARSTTNVSNALQGEVSGVSVTRSGSAPGSGNTIRIRGVTTLQGNSSPLVLVDDVPVESINDVNPDQIESISILKDGASASIYGSRAAAGVIIITTKQAKAGKFSVGYSSEFFIDKPTQLRKTVGTVRYLQMNNEQAWNDNGNPDDGEFSQWDEDFINTYLENNQLNPDEFPNTNWSDLILRNNATGSRHAITMSGGTSNLKSFANFSYEERDALYAHRNWRRIASRINNTINISDKFGANLNIAFRFTDDDQPSTNPTAKAIETPGIYAARWQDGRIAEGKTGENVYGQLSQGGFSENLNYLFYGKIGLFFKPVEELKLSVNLAPRFSFTQFKDFNNTVPYWTFDNPINAGEPEGYIINHGPSDARLLERRNSQVTLTTNALVNYEKTFDVHTIAADLGYEEFSNNSVNLRLRGNNFPNNDFPYLNQAPLDGVFDDNSSIIENAYQSYFGRLNYDFDKKYFFQVSMRRDGSSRFGKDFRWGSFPSVGLGWVISEENFMKSFDKQISFLKLRATYGSLGNDRLGNYLYQTALQLSDVLIANGNSIESVRSAAQRFLTIEDITWETTNTTNLGLDLTMFDSKLSITAEYFIKETKDMLLDLSLPDLIGFDDPRDNVGSMRTTGWEASVTWRDRIGKELDFSVSANIFDSKSIIGDIDGKRLFSGNVLSEEGIQFRSFFGYQSDGIYQTQEEVDNSAVTSNVVGPGDIKYKDISGPDGVPDGVINENDRVVLGGSLPRYQYGGNIRMSYKGIDFGLTFQGVAKSLKFIGTDFVRPFKESFKSPPQIYADSYYSVYNTPEQNAAARYPRLSANSNSNNFRFSDYYLQNGSYFRVKNITIGYTFPSHLTQFIKKSRLRIYAAGNDLFTIDNLPDGIDPELGNGYLITKTFIFGVKVNF